MFSFFNSRREYESESESSTSEEFSSSEELTDDDEEYTPSSTVKHVFTSFVDPKYAIDFLDTQHHQNGDENIVVVFPYANDSITPRRAYRNDNFTSFPIDIDKIMIDDISRSERVQEYSVSDLVIDITESSALTMIPTSVLNKNNGSNNTILEKTISAVSIVRKRSLVVAFVSGSPMGCAKLGEKFPDGFISTYRCAQIDFEVWILNEGLRIECIESSCLNSFLFSVSSRIHLACDGENPCGSLPIPSGDNLFFDGYDFILESSPQTDHIVNVNASIVPSRNKYHRQVRYSGETAQGHKSLMQIIIFKHPEFFRGIEHTSLSVTNQVPQ